MKTLTIQIRQCLLGQSLSPWQMGIGLLLFWVAWPFLMAWFNLAVGSVDAGIWQLIAMALFTWLAVLSCAYLVFRHLLQKFSLKTIHGLSVSFYQLSLWEQYQLYFMGYALLLASATGVLIAIC
jgi:hypothetical protein